MILAALRRRRYLLALALVVVDLAVAFTIADTVIRWEIAQIREAW